MGAEEFLNGVEVEVKVAKANVKEVDVDLLKATLSRAAIWTDMKEACLAVDTIAAELTEFNETLMPLFLKLKEKEPESEPVEEPVAEEPAIEKIEEPAVEKIEEPAMDKSKEPAADA